MLQSTVLNEPNVEYCGGVSQVVQDRKGHPTLAINFDDKTTQLFKEVGAGDSFRGHEIFALFIASRRL